MEDVTARVALSNALRYWEPRRLLYNAVLLAVVAIVYRTHLPASRSQLQVDTLLLLFLLAVLANVAYCACYIVDVVAQLSAFRPTWLRMRWSLLVVGLCFAGVLTYFFSLGFFSRAT